MTALIKPVRNCPKDLASGVGAAVTLSSIGTEWVWPLFGQSLPEEA